MCLRLGLCSSPPLGELAALLRPLRKRRWEWKRKKIEKKRGVKGKRWVRREERTCAVLKILLKSSTDNGRVCRKAIKHKLLDKNS